MRTKEVILIAMTKIPMKNAVAELDGDEMTRVLWQLVKDKLLTPYVDLKTEYYDLSLTKRDETDDKITYDAAEAIKRLGIGVNVTTTGVLTAIAAAVDDALRPSFALQSVQLGRAGGALGIADVVIPYNAIAKSGAVTVEVV